MYIKHILEVCACSPVFALPTTPLPSPHAFCVGQTYIRITEPMMTYHSNLSMLMADKGRYTKSNNCPPTSLYCVSYHSNHIYRIKANNIQLMFTTYSLHGLIRLRALSAKS